MTCVYCEPKSRMTICSFIENEGRVCGAHQNVWREKNGLLSWRAIAPVGNGHSRARGERWALGRHRFFPDGHDAFHLVDEKLAGGERFSAMRRHDLHPKRGHV